MFHGGDGCSRGMGVPGGMSVPGGWEFQGDECSREMSVLGDGCLGGWEFQHSCGAWSRAQELDTNGLYYVYKKYFYIHNTAHLCPIPVDWWSRVLLLYIVPNRWNQTAVFGSKSIHWKKGRSAARVPEGPFTTA